VSSARYFLLFPETFNVQNIDEATDADQRYKQKKRDELRLIKKEIFLKRQRQDLTQLVQKSNNSSNMQVLMKSLAGRLRHDDVLPINHLSCDPVWLEAFMTTMNYQEDTMYRLQQLHFGIAQTLTEIGTFLHFDCG
jgi:hypothetical protein